MAGIFKISSTDVGRQVSAQSGCQVLRRLHIRRHASGKCTSRLKLLQASTLQKINQLQFLSTEPTRTVNTTPSLSKSHADRNNLLSPMITTATQHPLASQSRLGTSAISLNFTMKSLSS